MFKRIESNSFNNVMAKLGMNETAKLVVAASFIKDLHLDNWGYTKEGLIIIDADSLDSIPDNSISAWLQYAYFGLGGLNIHRDMSINLIKETQRIYQDMLDIPLPPSHIYLSRSHEIYQGTLKALIKCCETSILKMYELNPDLDPEQPSSIFTVFLNAISTEKLRQERIENNVLLKLFMTA